MGPSSTRSFPVVQYRGASLTHGSPTTTSSFCSPSSPYSAYGFCLSAAPGCSPHQGPRAALRHRLLRAGQSGTGAGSTLPLASTNGYPTGRPIPSALLRNGCTLVDPVFTSCFSRGEPLPQMTNVSCAFFLSFTQLNLGAFHLYGLTQAATRASRTSTYPTHAAALRSFQQAVQVRSCLENTGDGDERRRNCLLLAY